MYSYKGSYMKFSKGFSMSLGDFKKKFASNHIFRNMKPKQREIELKRAHKIATKNGNISRSSRKIQTVNPAEDKERHQAVPTVDKSGVSADE